MGNDDHEDQKHNTHKAMSRDKLPIPIPLYYLCAYSGSRGMASKHVSLPLAFMEGDPVDWFRGFKICSAAND